MIPSFDREAFVIFQYGKSTSRIKLITNIAIRFL